MNWTMLQFAQIKMARGKYYGSAADLNLYGLPDVGADQFSSSAIWVLNDGDGLGPPEQTNGITVGWTVSLLQFINIRFVVCFFSPTINFQVNPPLYGDTNTRLFTYWTVSHTNSLICSWQYRTPKEQS